MHVARVTPWPKRHRPGCVDCAPRSPRPPNASVTANPPGSSGAGRPSSPTPITITVIGHQRPAGAALRAQPGHGEPEQPVRLRGRVGKLLSGGPRRGCGHPSSEEPGTRGPPSNSLGLRRLGVTVSTTPGSSAPAPLPGCAGHSGLRVTGTYRSIATSETLPRPWASDRRWSGREHSPIRRCAGTSGSSRTPPVRRGEKRTRRGRAYRQSYPGNEGTALSRARV